MGGQAQVVTFVLDALLEIDAALETVLVFHMASDQPRVQRALSQLSAEFAGECYRGRPMAFRHIPLRLGSHALPAIRTPREAEAAWSAGRDMLIQLKQDERRLHICIAGGPRILALTLLSAAMLHCDHHDRLWHLYTPEALAERAREGALLHVPPEEGVRLLPVPFFPWGAYVPGLRNLMQPALPFVPPLDPQDAGRCAAVWERLTPRQREVLEILASGIPLQEVAERLNITLKTLDTHKTNILAECRTEWALHEESYLNYHFLREKFAPWLAADRPR